MIYLSSVTAIVARNVAEVELASTPTTLNAILHETIAEVDTRRNILRASGLLVELKSTFAFACEEE